MKEIPILFSTAMVHALLAGRKTQTRRVVNPRTPEMLALLINMFNGIDLERSKEELIRCNNPYGKVGDVLYVKESYFQMGHWEEVPGVKTKGGRTKWRFVPDSSEILYDAPTEYRKGRHHKDSGTPTWHKRLARFMPKDAARIWLKVVRVKVELVQDISEGDARAEGILSYKDDFGRLRYKDYMANSSGYGDPSVDYPTVGLAVTSFCTLWEKINGRESWDSNPWVWVVEFEVLSTNGKPK